MNIQDRIAAIKAAHLAGKDNDSNRLQEIISSLPVDLHPLHYQIRFAYANGRAGVSILVESL